MFGEEIERKFIASVPKDLPRGIQILQGYLVIGEDGTEVRLRNKADVFYLTVKAGEGLVRKEAEIELTKESFELLWPMTARKRVEKMRYLIKSAMYTIELDIYTGSLDGLVIAEVEFPSVNVSQGFVAPDWFEKEVTTDPKFKNKNLALFGRPTS